MKDVITTEERPIKLWLDDVEAGALEQAKNVANLPFAFRHVALMPDCHQGYGIPIGGVFASKNVVIPNAVGVDIGCGMAAIRTNITDIPDARDLIAVRDKVKQIVPMGYHKHPNTTPALESVMTSCQSPGFNRDTMPVVAEEWDNGVISLGTLGGGNHFVELQRGSDGHLWVMVHSGSRNLGKKVCEYYNKKAIALNKQWFSSVPKSHQLAFLPMDTALGQNYLKEMQFCVDFAKANRRCIMETVLLIMSDVMGVFTYADVLDVAHNYAAMESHFGVNVLLHRKGATRAYEGMLGIIPGSQGTASYIVTGKGNRDSYMSCSHGAGRVFGRKHAKRVLDLDEEISRLDKQCIIHSIKTVDDLDEASGAYKDIDTVMENQKDLVEVHTQLIPLAVMKG